MDTIKPTLHTDVINPLLTDNYQITMAYAYFLNGRHNDQAVFETFFRTCPFKGQYCIFAGLGEVISFLKYFKITEEHVKYLRTILPKDTKEEFFKWFLTLDCSKIKISSLREGTLVFPRIPIIKLEGPLGLVQMIETPILNLVNFASLIATNAARLKREAQNKQCVEFGIRRAQGPDGGLSASQYSYLGGFEGTSNILAGMKYGIPIYGTMAHSFVTSYRNLDEVEEFEINGIKIKEKSIYYKKILGFQTAHDGELASFIAYAKAFSTQFVCLVDTYDTLSSGVPNFLSVAFALNDAKCAPIGIRLDSGDLAKLSQKSKELFRKAGEQCQIDTSKYIIVASNDINEESLKQLVKDKHQIDMFGIGTNLVTCQKQPALGLVYKLVDYKGDPKHKLSNDPEKSTLPGKKEIYRIYIKTYSYPIADLICLEGEPAPTANKEIAVINLSNTNERYNITPSKVEKILIETVKQGQLIEKIFTLNEARDFAKSQIELFNQEILVNENPKKYMIVISDTYYKFFHQCNENIIVAKTLPANITI